MNIPLFPLNTVLFPDGALPLKIFEPRYMDMARACLRDESPFGVCLIARGHEVGEPAEPHGIGTLATIGRWDMVQLGVLQVVARGGARFRILRRETGRDGLQRADVDLLGNDTAGADPVPGAYRRLLPLLRAIVAESGEAVPPPHRFDDASWVGMRFAERLPIPALARQKLLEIGDAIDRLEILYRFLEDKGLLPAS